MHFTHNSAAVYGLTSAGKNSKYETSLNRVHAFCSLADLQLNHSPAPTVEVGSGGGHSARRRRGAVTIITIKLKTSCYDITYYAHDTKFKSKLQNIRSNITKIFIGKLN